MAIKVGDKLPSVKLKTMSAKGPIDVTTDELFGEKKAILFALPGAFTPTCSAKHVPSFTRHADEFKEKGIELIACLSVNDAFVMGAWAKDQKAGEIITMLADGNGEFTRAVDLGFDGSAFGMGLRSQRYAMIVDQGVVTALNVEQPGAFDVSSGDSILKLL